MNSSSDSDFYSGSDISLSVSTRFWLYLIPNIISVVCSLFVLYYLLFQRKLRQSLNNHAFVLLIVIGLLFELVDVPLSLHFFSTGLIWVHKPSVSLFWTFIDFALYTSQIIIFSWTCLERHILIFHSQLLLTRRKRFLFHYFPLIFLVTYVFIYTFCIIYFPPCQNRYYPSNINGVPIPCVIEKTPIAKYDLIVNQIIPTFLILFSSIALFIRVLRQRCRFNRHVQWRRQRKMTVQLLSVSILYIFLNFPWTFLDLCYEIGLRFDELYTIRSQAYFFSCYIIFLFPLVCCVSLPELRRKIFCHHNARAHV